MTSETAKTTGLHHLGLTVPNLDATRSFFIEALGFSQVGARPQYPAVFVSDGSIMLTLWQAESGEGAIAFDRKNVIGLHHFALRVADENTLVNLHGELAARDDVDIEFAPESLGDGPTKHMMCRIPGNIRMELIAPG